MGPRQWLLLALAAASLGRVTEAFLVKSHTRSSLRAADALGAAKKRRPPPEDPNRPKRNAWDGIEDYMDETWHPRNQAPIVDKDWRAFRAEMIAIHDVTASESEAYAHLNSSRWAHELARLETGCVLVASPDVGGDFAKTVVVLFSHLRNGSHGAVLNHPAPEPTAQLLRESPAGAKVHQDLRDALGALPAFVGGPVEKQMITLVHNGPGTNGSVTLIQGEPGVYVGGFEGLQEKFAAERLMDTFRGKVLFGHAAWTPGQLRREVRAGKWYVAALSPDLVLDDCARGPEQLWEEIVRYLTYPELLRHQSKL